MARLLNAIADAFTGNRRQTSNRILSIAQRGKRDPTSLTPDEIRSVCMSLVSQARR